MSPKRAAVPREPLAVHETLAVLMHEAKVSVAELSRRSKVPHKTLEKVASGASRRPTLDTLIPIARALSDLLDRTVTAEELRGGAS